VEKDNVVSPSPSSNDEVSIVKGLSHHRSLIAKSYSQNNDDLDVNDISIFSASTMHNFKTQIALHKVKLYLFILKYLIIKVVKNITSLLILI
jgi:hypothetical protein